LSSIRTFHARRLSPLTLTLAGSAIALAAVAASVTTPGGGRPAVAPAAASQAVAAHPAIGAARAPGAAADQVPGAGAGQGPGGVVRASLDGSAVLLAHAASRHLYARRLARSMMRSHFHWTRSVQWRDLNRLWQRESSWNRFAHNPSSGAYGIPQATPGRKMASAGPRWRSNCRTQIRWGLRYIKSRYGSPRRAWKHEVAYGWY
jgi:Transglycosylase SLT domain